MQTFTTFQSISKHLLQQLMNKTRHISSTTIKDIAREAGVSYATVSRVINNYEHIKPETRVRVLTAMTRLGYVANQQARSLVGGRSQIIGLLIHAFDSPYIGQIIQGVDEAVAEAQYDLMLYTTHRRKARESTFVSSLARGLTDGLIVVLPRDAEAYRATLGRQGFPFVLVDYQAEATDIPAVSATNFQGAYEAMTYLIELGHHRIGMITGDKETGSANERLRGYNAALKDHGISSNSELIYEGDFFQPSGLAGADYLLSLQNPPTAIFASNDVMAAGAYETIRARGLRIPQDISVVGFDDIPQAAQLHPALTTVRQPLVGMGYLATQRLLKTIEDEMAEPLGYIELPTELILRDSAAPPDVQLR
jgi:LacI family transcriptional regulator